MSYRGYYEECICGRFKGAIRIVKIHDKLTLHICSKCDGIISQWDDSGQKKIRGKPRTLTNEEREDLR